MGKTEAVNENMVLRKVFEPKREEITEDCRKLHNERFHDFYSSCNIKRLTKSKKARQAEHVRVVGDK
jgi:UDP-2,3-diacylglucosamine pyrophosphatase LpxH